MNEAELRRALIVKELEKIKEEIQDLDLGFVDNELSDLKSELKGEQKVEKVDCDKTDCSNCINRNYCDYEYTNRKENKQ